MTFRYGLSEKKKIRFFIFFSSAEGKLCFASTPHSTSFSTGFVFVAFVGFFHKSIRMHLVSEGSL